MDDQAIETLVRLIRAALAEVPTGITNCAGYKCRQSNCEACFTNPEVYEVAPAREALDTLLTELKRLRRVEEAAKDVVRWGFTMAPVSEHRALALGHALQENEEASV